MGKNVSYVQLPHFKSSRYNKGEEIMSLHGQTTIAIVDAKENLFQLKNSLQKFFRNLMHYLKQKMMKAICPTLQTLQIKLQTMNFLLTVLGMNAANSKFSGIYCKIEKNDHFDMKKDKDFFGQGK